MGTFTMSLSKSHETEAECILIRVVNNCLYFSYCFLFYILSRKNVKIDPIWYNIFPIRNSMIFSEQKSIFFLAVLQISDVQALYILNETVVWAYEYYVWREKVLPFDALIAGFLSYLGAFWRSRPGRGNPDCSSVSHPRRPKNWSTVKRSTMIVIMRRHVKHGFAQSHLKPARVPCVRLLSRHNAGGRFLPSWAFIATFPCHPLWGNPPGIAGR